MKEDSSAAWAALDPPWRQAFELAWQSFQEYEVPVGAVLVDARGGTVSTGRTQRNAGSALAHAEMIALRVLPLADHTDHVLYTTVEPCLLCSAALRMCHVGTVRYAAADPYWRGIERAPELNEHIARHWSYRDGPLGGPWGTWAAVLHVRSALERGNGNVVAAHEEAMPEVLALARDLDAGDLRQLSTVDALARVWPELTERVSDRN